MPGEKTKSRMKRKQYEKTLGKLQTELARLQEWVVQQEACVYRRV